jgi:Phage integrase family
MPAKPPAAHQTALDLSDRIRAGRSSFPTANRPNPYWNATRSASYRDASKPTFCYSTLRRVFKPRRVVGRAASSPITVFSNRGETKNRSHCERCVGAAISDVLQMRHDMDRGGRAAYIKAAGIAGDNKGRLFRSMHKGDKLMGTPMTRFDVFQMIKRRAKAASLPYSTCCHTFRATGITTYLQNGGTLEHAQTIANHESPRTTKLYDRTREELSLEEIERVKI